MSALNGIFIDELIMRFILLEFFLSFGVEFHIAIILQAISYTIYYLDPTSKNRLKQAGMNFMHGITIGLIVIKCGWLFGLFSSWGRVVIWKIENLKQVKKSKSS